MITEKNTTASALVHYYVQRGMSDRLADAILVCRYLEALMEDLPAHQTGRIQPIFDYPQEELRDDWRKVMRFDLWWDVDGRRIVNCPPPSDGEPDLMFIHLPLVSQTQILFGRFAHLFK